ncbi:MAG: 1-(5-phosphoribosyl)-5-[(5-phosphoribosylamino)methylideneamino] imidazole-4-carboxamide isomerase [Spirochaetia bacterium]|jgi:phosphoribosylformimino-5-aminoimidazole carboxamide ribotide isomerase
MLLVPAIDLRDGRCVRLLRGSFSSTKQYPVDPVETARLFEAGGARWIHIVDLDAAEGRGKDNLATVQRIRGSVSCRLEVGGGVRTEEQAGRLFDIGVDLIVLGTILVRCPQEVAAWIRRLGPRFVGGVDAVDGKVRVAGWTEDGGRSDSEVAAGLTGIGVRGLIYTNISRDGTLAGPDLERTNAAACASGLPTLLSGGIGSKQDVRDAASRADPLVVGVILGKALYESRLDLGELVREFPQTPGSPWDLPAAV